MKFIIISAGIMLAGCTSVNTSSLEYNPPAEFNWMPNPLQWQHNVRDCRSQPQCNPADLFIKF